MNYLQDDKRYRFRFAREIDADGIPCLLVPAVYPAPGDNCDFCGALRRHGWELSIIEEEPDSDTRSAYWCGGWFCSFYCAVLFESRQKDFTDERKGLVNVLWEMRRDDGMSIQGARGGEALWGLTDSGAERYRELTGSLPKLSYSLAPVAPVASVASVSAQAADSLPRRECLRCGHTWKARKAEKPLACAKCHNPYWDTPRVRPKKDAPAVQATTEVSERFEKIEVRS